MALPLLNEDPVWAKLVALYKDAGSKLDMRELFQKDSERFQKFRLVYTIKCHLYVINKSLTIPPSNNTVWKLIFPAPMGVDLFC